MHVWFRPDEPQSWAGPRFPVFVRESGQLHGWGIGDVDDGLVKITLASPSRWSTTWRRTSLKPQELTPAGQILPRYR